MSLRHMELMSMSFKHRAISTSTYLPLHKIRPVQHRPRLTRQGGVLTEGKKVDRVMEADSSTPMDNVA